MPNSINFFAKKYQVPVKLLTKYDHDRSIQQQLLLLHPYISSIQFKTSTANFNTLQQAHNILAQIVLLNLHSTHIISLLSRLHWLPVTTRIKYKPATIAHKLFSVTQPTHLHLLFQQYQPVQPLCSGDQNLLALPSATSEFGRRAFSYLPPLIWNDLQLSIRSLQTFDRFKSHLKTYLFTRC